MEQSFLAWLRGRLRDFPQVAVGIGDDAAVIDIPPGHQLVATTDTIVDGVDFLVDQHPLEDIGFKSLAINLSDIAAMGAQATSALVTLSLPSRDATQIAAAVYEGILRCAKQYGVAIAGGDLSVYDGPLSISVVMHGLVPTGQAWLRTGAQQGDLVVLSGPVGGSLLGRHLRPTPRLDLPPLFRQLGVNVHAAIDISDGLSLDLDRLCASSGVGAELDLCRIAVHPDAQTRAERERIQTAVQHALGDGEDFELILALTAADYDRIMQQQPGIGLHPIGKFVSRTGLWTVHGATFKRLTPSGYIHGQTRGSQGSSQEPA